MTTSTVRSAELETHAASAQHALDSVGASLLEFVSRAVLHLLGDARIGTAIIDSGKP